MFFKPSSGPRLRGGDGFFRKVILRQVLVRGLGILKMLFTAGSNLVFAMSEAPLDQNKGDHKDTPLQSKTIDQNSVP